MNQVIVAAGFGLMMFVSANPAEAKGCITGAAVGAVAGHVAGHHAVLGAAAGCVINHHRNKVMEERARDEKDRRSQAAQASQPQAAVAAPQPR